MRYTITLLLFFITNFCLSQYITIDQNYTAEQLVRDVLINSPCASVSNISISGANFTNGEKSFGYFNGNGTTFPFQDGIILSTGKASDAPGPTTPRADSGQNINWPGDNDLNQILNVNSENATIIEFDFIPLGDQISFDYIFSSEEYEENTNYPCRYSDGFAFLLKEVGAANYQNLALIPNTNIPVKVTTVHPAINVPGGCPAQNEQYFDAFNGTQHPTVYNGQTVVLTAQSTVTPGVQYHIKLVIADEEDARFDSAIFLKGGSFNLGVNIGENRTIADGNPVCPDENLILDATLTGVQSYQWYYNGTLLTGETNATLNIPPPHSNNQNGEYAVDISFGPSCQTNSKIDLEFAPELIVAENSFSECDDLGPLDGIRTYHLSSLIPFIFPNLPTNYQIAFFESPTSTTALPDNFTTTIPYQQIIYVRTTNIKCYGNIPITLNTKIFDQGVNDQTLILCKGESLILSPGNGFQSYLWNTSPSQNTATISINTPGNYDVTLENSEHCFKTITFTVLESESAIIQDIIIDDIENNNNLQVIVSGNGDYEYSIDGIHYQDSNLFEYLHQGVYDLHIRDKNGCGITTKETYILDYPKFFTPNGDGHNDTWNIKNLEKRGLEETTVFIMDRYGKLLKQFNPTKEGWNGIFNGKSLPADDYWFILKLANGKTVKNHFSLKR